MPLNPTQMQVVLDWLKARGGAMVCPYCAWQAFEISDELASTWPVGYVPDGGQKVVRTRPAPLVVLTCKNCGNGRHFSALVMGIAAVPKTVPPLNAADDLAKKVRRLIHRYGS